MKRIAPPALLNALLALGSSAHASPPVQFASTVVDYNPGAGFVVGYDNPGRALGAPTFADPFGFGPITPFNPPFLSDELVSIGAGGHLTLGFASSIFDRPENSFGIDFIIYGNEGFVDFDYPNGLTGPGGEVFSDFFGAPPLTVVSVSYDNSTYYDLLAPAHTRADVLYPSDSAGDLGVPVDPALTQADFANQSLAGIRSLYAGSAGGTGFDLAWAVDGANNPVALDEIRYVRISVLSGKAEVDAVASTVPDGGAGIAGTLALLGLAVGARRKR
jgi:hypothetical protein